MEKKGTPNQTPIHAIPRRIKVNDPSELPNEYSTTPGGTLYSTTPGGKLTGDWRALRNVFLKEGIRSKKAILRKIVRLLRPVKGRVLA